MAVSFALYILLFGVFLNVRYCDGIDDRSRPMRPNETCDIVGKCKEYGECKPGADVCMFAGGTSRVNDEECVIPEDACDQIYAVNKCGKIGTNKAMQYLKFLCDEKARPCSHIPPTTVAPTTMTKVPRTTTTTATVMSSEMSPSTSSWTDPSNNTSTCPICDCLSSGNLKSHINLALVMISSTIYLICGFAHFFH